MVLPTRASQLQRSEKDRWSFISECSGQAGKIAILVGSDEIFNIVFTVFNSLFQWANEEKRQHGQ